MKRTLLIFSMLLGAIASNGQTYATDFNALDCSGNPHQLFAELDQGKVIVIAWVMPCASCIGDALDAYVAANSYSTSHPGRVLYYLVDDEANTSCPTLTSWGNNYGITNCPKFSDASISMFDYGGYGMPKIVVVGGTHHQIYFSKNESTQGINQAIDKALIGENTVGMVENENSRIELNAFPNPANTALSLTYTLNQSSLVKLDVFDATGKLLSSTDEERKEIGQHQEEFNTNSFNNGLYFIKVSTELGVEMVRFTVSH
jgi:hypothetical protein